MKFLGLKWRQGGFVGYWNGKRITGVEVKFKVFFRFWCWMPTYNESSNSVLWLCFWAGWSWCYGKYIKDEEADRELVG